MKKLILAFLGIAVLISCTTQKKETSNFSINGTITGDYAGKAYLYKRDAGEWIKLDSATVQNGSFDFKGTIDFPELYYVTLKGENYYAPVFVEKSQITFKSSMDDFQHPEITGSASQDEFNAFQEKANAYNDQMNDAWQSVKAARNEGNKENEAKFEAAYNTADSAYKQFILNYAMEHDTSVVGAYEVLRNAYYYDEKELEPVVNKFDQSIRQASYVQKLADRVNVMKRVAVGQPAVDFTMNDTSDQPIILSSLYGKYLLVDFWASWCGPCRRENPNVVATYNEYKDKGFDILGVSFDDDKAKWLDAIKADKLDWHQVSDLKGWGNEAGKLYAINSIPSNILLDPKGTIIAKNLRGEDLKNKLQELIK